MDQENFDIQACLIQFDNSLLRSSEENLKQNFYKNVTLSLVLDVLISSYGFVVALERLKISCCDCSIFQIAVLI